MAKMPTMSERREYTTKIPGRSIPEVAGRFGVELARQAGVNGIRFADKKLTAEAMTNAIILHFLSMQEPERNEVLKEFVPIFDAMMSGEMLGSVDAGPDPTKKLKRGSA